MNIFHFSIVVKRNYSLISLLILVFLTSCSDHKTAVSSEKYKYDNKGRLIEKITPDGGKTRFKHNDNDLIEDITYPKGFTRYGYDKNGNRTWAQNKKGKTTYQYDAFNRLIEVVFKYSPEKTIKYEYDPWNRVSGMAILSNDQIDYNVKYEYDIFGNPTSIDNGNGVVKYRYFYDKGKITRSLPNGIKTHFLYSPLGDLVSLEHFSSSNSLIASYHYKYDSPGKISFVKEKNSTGVKTIRYEWDGRGYLKALHLSDGNSIHYKYDSMGNRLSMSYLGVPQTYDYDDFGRIIKAGNTKYTWNKNGNLSSRIENKSKTKIKYDGLGLPILIRTPDTTIRYSWDSDKNLISKRIGKDITYYLPNPLSEAGITLAEYDNSGKLSKSYLYGDVLLGVKDTEGGMQYFLEDGFNSIRLISNQQGAVTGRRDYSPFAEPIFTEGNFPIDFRTTGERFLPEIKSFVIGGRLYDPHIGRYSAPDLRSASLMRFDSLNKYAHGCRLNAEPRCNQTHKNSGVYRPIDFNKPEYRQTSPFRTPTGYKPIDFRRPEFKLAWEFIEKGQRLPTGGKGLTEKELRKLEPDYYQMIDSLAPLTPENYLKGFGLSVEIAALDFAITYLGGFSGAIQKAGNLFFAGKSQIKEAWNKSFDIYDVGKIAFAVDKFSGGSGLKDPVSFIIGKPVVKGIEKFQKKRIKDRDELLGPLSTAGLSGGGPGGGPPPSGGGSPFGGGDSGSGGGFGNLFKAVEKKLGGVSLDVEPQVAEDLRIGALKGVTYDPVSKKIVLIGDQNLEVPSIRIGDLAEALTLVYNPKINGQLQFSLDPDDPKNPKGKWLKAVYIPKDIQGTEIGRIMFETDWLLKQYSFGVKVEENRTIERKTQVHGYKSIADISLDNPSASMEPLWARMWIVEKNKKIKLHKKGNTVYIEEPEMIVKAKRQVPDPNSKTGLRDVESDNPSAKEFARTFSRLYNKIAIESPEFARLKEYAKALVVAMWLKDMNFPYDYDWVNKNLYSNKKYTQKVNTISWKKQRRREYPVPGGIEIQKQSIYLFGGVDAGIKPEYVATKDKNFNEKSSLMDTIVQKELANGLSGRFTFLAENKDFTGIIIPLEKQPKKKKPKAIEVKGTRYEFGENGKIVKSISSTGSTTSYSYNPTGNLKIIESQNKNGWKLNGKKNDNGSIWTVTKPDNSNFTYNYDKSGFLNTFEVNGEKWAEYEYNKKRNEVNVSYADYAEKIHYDLNKNITEYEVTNLTNHKKEKIKFAYHKAGNISGITVGNKSLVRVSYQGNSARPTSVATPRAKINYSYGNNGSLQKLTHSSGISVDFQYENKQIKKLNLSYKNREAEYLYGSNGIIKSKSLSGLITDYRYKKGRISSVETKHYGKAEYAYDSHNRLQEIHFPDGTWIEFKYSEKRSKKAKLSDMTYTVITIYHPKAIASSSSITSKETNIQNENIASVKKILKKKLEGNIAAIKKIKNSVVLDLFIENDFPHLNLVNSKGQIQQIDLEMAKKFRKLINLTSKTRGKLGRTLIKRWGNFYDNHLASMAKASYQKLHDGEKVTLKPVLIIKSNEVNYKYSNLEKVPALAENFIVFIASKSVETESMHETSIEKLIRKINDIPSLDKENVVFTIRPPDMNDSLKKEWENTVAELQKIVGKKNVLFNPTKQQFGSMLARNKKEIIVIELTHTDNGIMLKGNEIFNSKDILKGADLSHIKYLLSGLGTCNLPQLEKGGFEASLRQKGVGIINGSYRDVKGDIALKRLKMLIQIFKSINHYDLPAYYLPDIIDQLLKISGKQTIHLGKLKFYKKQSILLV